MTFTAKMAVLIARHRILVYGLATLALTAYLVLGFNPSNALSAPAALDSPASIIGKAKGNCDYLTICRWSNLSSYGEPPIIGIPVLFIINMMFSVAHFIFFLIGQSFIYVGNLGFYNNLLYFGDGVFSQVALVKNNQLAAGSLIGTIIFAGIIIAAFIMVRGAITGRNGQTQMSPLRTIAWMVGGLVALSVMATASAKNHDGTSQIAQIAGSGGDSSPVYNTTDQQSIRSLPVSEAAKDPNKWQPYSLGWVVAWGNTAAAGIGNIVTVGVTTVTSALNVNSNEVPSGCDIYVESMNDLYKNGNRDPKNSTPTSSSVLELEKLYRSAVLDPYVASNFGSSVGAGESWCRVMDMRKSVAQQVLIAKNAEHLAHGNVELYKPALDVMLKTDSYEWKAAEEGNAKSSISGNNNFTGVNWGAGFAASYFSPVKYSSQDGIRVMHSSYFAMCRADREKMVLNSEWAGVIQAGDDNKESFGDLVSPDGKNICTAVANGDSKDIAGADGDTVAIGFMPEATDPNGETGKKDFQERLDYTDKTAQEEIISLLFQGNASREHKFIAASGGGISGPAYNFFSSFSGANWTANFFPALIMLFVSYLIARIAFPVVIGGAVAQFFGAGAMMIVAFALMAVALWPTYKVRSFAVRTFAVIIAGSVVSTLFTLIFIVYAGLFNFIKSVLFMGQTNTVVGVIDFIVNGIPLLLAGLISYTLMKLLLLKVLKFDATNVKTAMGSSMNAVMAPMSKDNQTFGQIMSSPLKSAASMVTTPVKDTANQFKGLRNAGSSVMDTTANILSKRNGAAGQKKENNLTPQGATSTANAGQNNGTDANPLIGAVIGGPGAPTGGGARPHGAGPTFAGVGPALTDEQHRQRLMDQLKGSYGSIDTAKAFPNGVPGDYATLIANAPLDEVKRLSQMLDTRVEGSDAPRATPQQAAENMKKFADMGAESMRMNPSGFDPSVGYAERSATQANMFRGANPLTDNDLVNLSETDKKNFDSRKFDLIGDTLPDGRSVSFGNNADVIKGEVVPDPLTARSVPNAIVRSGSQNFAPLEGVTQEGTTLFGAKREQNPDGSFSEDWSLATLDSGARQLPSSMFGSSVPPVGVSEEEWNDVGDLHAWIKDNKIQMDSTAMSTWPAPRREQAGRVADVLGGVMSSQGVPMVNPDNLESLAGSGVGISSADESFTFGEKVPNSDFDPSGMRNALSEGQRRMAALESASAERAEMLMSQKIESQLSSSQESLTQQERSLERKLEERTSMLKDRATSHLAGLIGNESDARDIGGLLRSEKWDEITELLNDSDESGNDSEGLKDQIRSVVEASKSRLSSLENDHRINVAQLYTQLAEEREAITEVMYRDVEAELQNDIARNADGVRELAFSGASETSKRHVEGMLSWFPAVKSKFFSGNSHPDQEDMGDVEDADGDGIDDRYQVSL